MLNVNCFSCDTARWLNEDFYSFTLMLAAPCHVQMPAERNSRFLVRPLLISTLWDCCKTDKETGVHGSIFRNRRISENEKPCLIDNVLRCYIYKLQKQSKVSSKAVTRKELREIVPSGYDRRCHFVTSGRKISLTGAKCKEYKRR